VTALPVHLLCLTIDGDPDGLAGQAIDRSAQSWGGLEAAQLLPDHLANCRELAQDTVPMTWLVRADDQIADWLGSATAMLERYGTFWQEVRKADHELGWHPHLYVRGPAGYHIAEPAAACEQMERTWELLEGAGFRPALLRNGEGWHHASTFATAERLGLRIDSTAIPGRTGGADHPMDWTGAPNQPYYPSRMNLRCAGPPRAVLEMPMNTWMVRAPYDTTARLRYMNPAIHEHLFAESLEQWDGAGPAGPTVRVWVLILHPEEARAGSPPDPLYARSPEALARNLARLANHIRARGHTAHFVTLSAAAALWQRAQEAAA
jgi:hypothetical protein